jgi:hypothetical protein
MRQLKSFEKQLGCEFEISEESTEVKGGDTMHRMRITPKFQR